VKWMLFVRVVERGSFSGAARLFGMTPSAISKLVARLERRLGARLLLRSTRQLQLAAEGRAFFERSLGVLADLEEAERGVLTGGAPRGPLRVSANFTLAEHVLIPLAQRFLLEYPDITLDLAFTDEVINILEQRTDVAVRAGPLKSSSLVARKLGQTRMVVVATPAYLNRQGVPKHPNALGRHNLLGLSYARSIHGWPFARDGENWAVPVAGNVQVSDGQSLHRLVLGGPRWALAATGTGLLRLLGETCSGG
jgi:DNA-binding transcriptional LysR family regulator